MSIREVTVKMKFTRSDVAQLVGAFDVSSKVSREESEDRDWYMKFKYRMGRNWARCRTVAEETERLKAKVLEWSEDYTQYIREREELIQEFAAQNDEGAFIMQQTANGQGAYTFKTAEARKQYEGMAKQLVAKWQAAIEGQLAKEGKAAALDAELVEVEIATFPWEHVPEKITGGFLDLLTPVWTYTDDADREG